MSFLLNSPLQNIQNSVQNLNEFSKFSNEDEQQKTNMAGAAAGGAAAGGAVASFMVFILVFMIVLIVLSFMAVPKFIKGNSDNAKNKRILAYVLLVLSGFQISWIYIILWMIGLNLGD